MREHRRAEDMEERYTIDTPENIEFAYTIAGIGSRFLAAIIDSFVIIVLQIAIWSVFQFFLSNRLNLDLIDSQLAAIATFLSFCFLWGYYIIFEMIWNGQSLGKRVLGLRVVREGGRPITFASSAIRNLIRAIDFLPSFYGIGVITMFIDRRARRLGDLAAGTLVIKEGSTVTLESLTKPAFAAVPPTSSASASVAGVGVDGRGEVKLTLENIHVLNDRDYQLIQEFLSRRNELGSEARLRLGSQLASGLQARLGVPQGGEIDRFLQLVVTEYQVYRQQQTRM